MSRRTWVDSGIWYDTRKLSPLMRDLYLHLLVNENGNCAGYYKLNLMHLAVDIGTDEDTLLEMLNSEHKYWKFDQDTEQVLIPKFTKYNIVRGKPQITRLNAELTALTPCQLDKEFIKAWVDCNGIGSEELLDEKFRSRGR